MRILRLCQNWWRLSSEGAKRIPFIMSYTLSSGAKIPKIGFGVYQIPAEEAREAVITALETGYRLIDSAIAYQNEEEVGKGIYDFLQKHPEIKRSDIYYTTKIAVAKGYDDAVVSIQESFNKVKQLGYIDLFLIHSPLRGGKATRLGVWKALNEAKAKGFVKDVGVSNFGIKHIKELEDEKLPLPVLNQLELHPWLQRRELVEYGEKRNILAEAYSPLTQAKLLDDPRLVELATKYKKSPAQILIRWSIQNGLLPLPKSVTPKRIKENLDVFDFEISPEDLKSLGSSKLYSVFTWDPTTWD